MKRDKINAMRLEIPREVKEVVAGLEKGGFEAYIVGGCVRDLLLGREPDDWDVTTNAKPEEIQKIFPESFYENKFFTVTVQTESDNPMLKEIEVTTYRTEFEYEDKRRPGKVEHAEKLEDDLARRDFTINAIALDRQETIVDPFDGQKDLKGKLIRAVGNPDERFAEDALRMMRAIRFAAQYGFQIEGKTKTAIQKHAADIQHISQERIRDEFVKIILSERAIEGVEQLRELSLLKYIIPELEEGYGVEQNLHHIYTVWEHNLKSLQYAGEQKWHELIRLAALLHDVAKPRVKQGKGRKSTFYGHEVVGAKMARQILLRLKFPKEEAEKVAKLIRYHMFYYNVDEVTESSVRRLLRKIGPENIQDLLKLRMADRIGSGVPKAQPYKLRHWQYMVEKVSSDPLSLKMIKLNGDDVMKLLGVSPGPRIGWILQILFAKVLEEPTKNTSSYLEGMAKELHQLGDEKLQKLAKKARIEIERVETTADESVKQKYFVK